jgi:hypothetical protein
MFQTSLPSSDELSCHTSLSLRRLQQLEDLFRNDLNKDFAIQSVYGNTPEYGVVTISRRKALYGQDSAPDTIGINITNKNWPSIRYDFDRDVLPGSFSLVNAAGRVSAVVAYTVLPCALDLLDAVVTSVRRVPCSLSCQIPADPNLTYCTFR